MESERLQRIHVSAKYGNRQESVDQAVVEGNVSDERRKRLKKEIAKRLPGREWAPTIPITPELLEQMAKIEHVEYVWPDLEHYWQFSWDERDDHGRVMSTITGPQGVEPLIVAGRGFNADDEKAILVHEFFVYDWGFRDDSQLDNFLGEQIRVENYSQRKHVASFFDHFSGSKFSVTEKAMLGSLLLSFPELVDQIEVPDDSKELLKRAFTAAPPEDEDRVEVSEEYEVVGIFRSPTDDERDSMLLGLAGGSLGVLSGWGISLGMDSWVRSILEGEFHEPMTEPMFVFPAWLALSVPLFCGIVTTAAAFYPARRAASINPVQALRHD